MTQILSKPTTLVVYPGASGQFGTGSDKGSYSAGVWTPGRDAAGNVNQSSWDLVPKGTWIRVVGSEMSQLDSVVKAALPGWMDYNSWDQLVRNSWGGLAFDWWAGNRMWWMGGGHNASTNNGVYRFDHLKCRWAVEALPTNPTDPAVWDAGYDGSGAMPSMVAATLSKYRAKTLGYENDVFSDEWGGKPYARHTYNWMVYAPNLNRLLMGGRRFWSLNMNTGTWDYKRITLDSIPTEWYIQASQSIIDPEHGTAIWDEVTNEYLWESLGSSGQGNAGSFNWNTKKWAGWATPAIWDDPADTRVGRNVIWMNAGRGAGTQWGIRTPSYRVYNLDTRNVTANGEVQYSGGWSTEKFYTANSSVIFDDPALIYVPPLNRYWYWTAVQGYTVGFFEIDPTTTPWTCYPKIFSGDVPVPSIVLGRKLMWSPALNAVLYVNDGSTPMYLYKF